MKQNIIHIGLDVDDTQYHGSALDKITAVKFWTLNVGRP